MRRTRLSPQPDPRWYPSSAGARPGSLSFTAHTTAYLLLVSLSPLRAIMQSETASDARLQHSYETGNYQSREDRQRTTLKASQLVDDRENEYEPLRSSSYRDERLSVDAVDQLLPSETTSTCSEQHESRSGKCEKLQINTLPAIDSVQSPARCRKTNALSTLGQAALDLCITGTSIYFIAFAVMAISHMGDSEALSTVQNLLTAARFVSRPLAIFSQNSPTDEI